MSLVRRLLHNPQEVNFFLFLAAFALVIGAIYWFLSYEPAGTVLLLAFGLATGVVGIRLATDPAAARVRRRAAEQPEAAVRLGEVRSAADVVDLGGRGAAGQGTADFDRPFGDERGRIPSETLAPFAVGLGVAIAVTGTIFGLAPVAVGILPFVWGAWTWLGRASAEYEATVEADDRLERERATAEIQDARPVEAPPARPRTDRAPADR